MKEKNTRRDWIKNATIIFLAILLVLTFFSNTIMNYSLPEVATVYIQPGSIATRVRGNATIVAGDPYNVKATQSRTISSVVARAGDTVSIGDVLYVLQEGDSLELEKAEEELAALELEYMKSLFTGNVNANIINKVENDEIYSFEEYRDKIGNAQAAQRNAERSVEKATEALTEAERKLAALGVGVGGAESANPHETLTELRRAENHAITSLNGIMMEIGGQYFTEIPAVVMELRLRTILQDLYKTEKITAARFESASGAYDQLIKAYDKAVKEYDQAVEDATKERAAAQETLADAKVNEAKRTEDATLIFSDIQDEITFNEKKKSLDKKREEVESLRANPGSNEITAPVAGTLSSLSYVAGETIALDSTVAVIVPEGKGFSASFSVSNEQAGRVNIGDPAEIQGGWWWNDITLVMTGKRPDPESQGQRTMLIFSVSGSDLYDGQQISISVGQRSANYDLTAPSSAIREDANGNFILIVETRSTPLNNRYFATRVDVEVMASDDYNTAIQAPLYGWEYVITSSTAPITAGQQVRLTN